MTTHTSLELSILGIGALGPGYANWPELRALITNGCTRSEQRTLLHNPEILPPAERRRASIIVKTGLTIGLEACQDAHLSAIDLPAIFASSGGDSLNCNAICEQLASDDRLISPTRFHNSVHNTVAGYWGIATGCMRPSQVISAEDGSFAAGLFEAATQAVFNNEACLLVCYDTAYPMPMHAIRPISDTAGVALVISPRSTNNYQYPGISIGLETIATPRASDIPALNALPLLRHLAQSKAGTVNLYYQPECSLAVSITP